MSLDAVMIDLGGVLCNPDAEAIGKILRAAGVNRGAWEIEAAGYPGDTVGMGFHPGDSDEQLEPFFRRYACSLGVSEPKLAMVAKSLREVVLSQPWRFRSEARAILGRIARTGVAIAIVSNAAGDAEQGLMRAGICQVGEGDGVSVRAIVDSHLVGVAKPDPEIFRVALERLECPASRSLHVGDSVRNDVECARHAGIEALHFDPAGRCERSDHPHIETLDALASLVERRQGVRAREGARR